MSDPPLPPHVADLLVRVKLETRRQRLDEALERLQRLEQGSPPTPTTDPTDDTP